MNNRRTTDQLGRRPGNAGEERTAMRRAIRLLLADDHRMLREGLRRSMAELGFTIVG